MTRYKNIRHILAAIILAITTPLMATTEATTEAIAETAADSLHTTDIEEVVVVSTPKENARLRQQPLSSTAFSQTDLRERAIDGMKSLTANVPGLFIPAYGSHLTTSVYIRGIGSRTGTPAVALYVDGVPQISSASFDFNFAGVDRIDVLRGPQSTLYGRNSMGGVIRVFTKNPMQYQGTDITISASHGAESLTSAEGGKGRGRLTMTHYHRVCERFAFSAHLFGERDGGYFRNKGREGELIDDLSDLGVRMRFIFKPKTGLDFDLTASHEWLRQGGYPYEYQGVVGSPTTPDPRSAAGTIAYDNRSGYKRSLTNVGLTTERKWSRAKLTSVTGFQHLHDRMDLDQDFTDRNLYTLLQRQNANTISEEIILRSPATDPSANRKLSNCPNVQYSWLLGLAAIRQWNTTDGPVTFHDDGLAWLNGLANRQGNAHLPTVTGDAYTMNFVFDNQILGEALAFPGTYETPMTNAALFHQSTFDNLFGAQGLSLTAGLRLDYERLDMSYDTRYAFDQRYALGGRLTFPDGSVRDGMALVAPTAFHVQDQLAGELHDDYFQLLPKVTLQWSQARTPSDRGTTDYPIVQSLYASVSRGYRSGGYNIQMFSDLLQSRMQTRIMQNVTASTLPIVEAQPSMPDVAKATVRQILTSMSEEQPTDVEAATWYKPESSWNYEVGVHTNFLDNRLLADVAAFWMETRDQQVSKMSAGGLGRVTVNSGRSRSLGAEVTLRARPFTSLDLQASYGYTHARFRGQTDTYVPFVPRHTFSAGATQTWTLGAATWLDAVILHADYRAAGTIFWNEANTASQPFAGTLNARLTLAHVAKSTSAYAPSLDISLFATNILSTRYRTFYFETMQRGFAQYTRPAEIGIDLRLRM